MRSGLVEVDRRTLERTVRPSARFFGEVARAARLAAGAASLTGRDAARHRGSA